MPLPPATVGFAISLAAGLVKLGVRVDRIFAEQEAVRSDLALPERLLILATAGGTDEAEAATVRGRNRGGYA